MGLYHKIKAISPNYNIYEGNNLYIPVSKVDANYRFFQKSINGYDLYYTPEYSTSNGIKKYFELIDGQYVQIDSKVAISQKYNNCYFYVENQKFYYSKDNGITYNESETFSTIITSLGLTNYYATSSNSNPKYYIYGPFILSDGVGFAFYSSSFQMTFIYTNDFVNFVKGKTYNIGGVTVSQVKQFDDKHIILTQYQSGFGDYTIYYVDKFNGNEYLYSKKLSFQSGNTTVPQISALSNNSILVYQTNTNNSYIVQFRSSEIYSFELGYSITGSKIYVLVNNCLIFHTINTNYVYKIDINGLEERQTLTFTDTTPYFSYMTYCNNYVLLYGASGCSIINIESFTFWFDNEIAKLPISTSINYVLLKQPTSSKFEIEIYNAAPQTTSLYTFYTELQNIKPEDRRTIYANDYSTITGSQILENSVRSVNHKITPLSIKNDNVGSYTLSNFAITDNPTNWYMVGNNKKETYIQTFTGLKLTTSRPIIGEINSSNFSFSSINKQWYKHQRTETMNENSLYKRISEINDSQVIEDWYNRYALDKKELETVFGVEYNENNSLLVDEAFKEPLVNQKQLLYSISNINKIDEYNVEFDCQVLTRTSDFIASYAGSVAFPYTAIADIIEAQTVTITLNCKTILGTETEFVFSIDINDKGQYIQNNPFTRNNNELFSLSEDFFKEQAQAIIDTNKDGRMVLTVNTTSDLNLYNGKELTVTMKDGTLANNGAIFEVVNIKEKFTGFSWKQVLTLKEKND